MEKGKSPFVKLGQKLRAFRYGAKESLHEVSGAVELEADIVESYENGERRPSEDVLSLLLSHYGVSDDEADEIWDLAGYGEASSHQISEIDSPMPTGNVVVIPIDGRIVYSDSANISINKHGVVMTFMQNSLMGPQQVPAARVGMSLEHAKEIHAILGKTISEATAREPKKLPPKNTDAGEK